MAPTTGTADPYTTASNYFSKAGGGYDRFEGGVLSNINDYLSPYYNTVIDNTLGRMRDDRTRTLGQVGDQAAAAGAFGGSRHGLVESNVYDTFNRNMGEYVDRASQDAFNAAAALQGQDFGQQTAINQFNRGMGDTYLGVGNQIQQQQAAYGAQEQALLQQILTGGAQQWQNMWQHPYQIIDALNAALGIDPRRAAGSAQSSTTPGMFDYLSLAGQTAAGLL